MIEYKNGAYRVKSSGRSFTAGTQDLARLYSRCLGYVGLASPQDIIASNSASAQDLCHHLSHGDIEQMVCHYLNGDINLNQFMILVGSVMRPSWSNLTFPPTMLSMLRTWTLALVDRIQVIALSNLRFHDPAARAANSLVDTLNSAITNLRYAHRSSNRSIQGHFDLRVHRGGSIDPIQLAVMFYAWTQNRSALAAESSALLNDWENYARSGIPVLANGGLKMSEGNDIVTRTKRSHNPVMGASSMPVRLPIVRGSAPIWLPVSIDSALYIFGVVLVAWAFGLISISFPG